MEKHYIINPKTMYMKDYHDSHDNWCTKVVEVDKVILVRESPLEILKYSILWVGLYLNEAMEASKSILDINQMCPVLVNPMQRISFFPVKSPNNHETFWFNPAHIVKAARCNQKTHIDFSNGLTLVHPSRLSSFNSNLRAARQLKSLTLEIEKSPVTFVLDPKNGRYFLSCLLALKFLSGVLEVIY